MNPFPWRRRIERAEQLAAEYPASAEMLRFYAEIARFQKGVYERLRSSASGTIEPAALDPDFRPFLRLIQRIGPHILAEEALDLECGNTSLRDILAEDWDSASGLRFFARALLQPYFEWRVEQNGIPAQTGISRCPFCGEKPQMGVLRQEGDGAKRSLVCSLCSSEWEFRRLLCPECGEENRDKLPVYVASDFPHVRIEACDACHTYIKSVDLTKDGLAVPCVDEIATTPLNLWAEERGYTKVEASLLGM